ncbi:ferritin-like domain-containing protein [Geopyxis carbonaria]|nr:ferritin-like domain-containing protein [Geopyxis carbonaria]
MLSFKNILTIGVQLLALTAAHPVSSPCPLGGLDHEQHVKRQAATGLDDMGILQFALTLEHLEAAFYKDGFAKFAPAEFMKLGATQKQIDDLVTIGETEATHVKVLSDTITSLGGKPVKPCTYDFKFTDASGMLAVARVLEAVGISAYLGAAPLVTDKTVLGAAASIVTVESRHQTLIRTVLSALSDKAIRAVPQAFDVGISARQVFTLAAAFITECPKDNFDLGLTPFPTLSIAPADQVMAGSKLSMGMSAPGAAEMFCGFTSGDLGTLFSKFLDGSCTVPDGMGGEVYVTITSKEGKTLEDSSIVAGYVPYFFPTPD